jgi:hypothetical protein
MLNSQASTSSTSASLGKAASPQVEAGRSNKERRRAGREAVKLSTVPASDVDPSADDEEDSSMARLSAPVAVDSSTRPRSRQPAALGAFLVAIFALFPVPATAGDTKKVTPGRRRVYYYPNCFPDRF